MLHEIFFFRQALAGNSFLKSPPPPAPLQELNGRPLRVINDILLAMNSQQVTLLVVLDLSAPFDTANYEVLLKRLHAVVVYEERLLIG